MKFFFPDSQDQIDPAFDFITEEKKAFRIRQRDDLYAHEALEEPPFDGLLVSKAIVDGTMSGTGKYTVAQRHRLYREGAEQFFRLSGESRSLQIMGDCGAFNYFGEEYPPYTPDEVIDFYQETGLHIGISVDHVIFGFKPVTPADDPKLPEWSRRQEITLNLAAEFWRLCQLRKVDFVPMGVAQGWDPDSYAHSVEVLQKIGFKRIALGGMVPLKTADILLSLRRIADDRAPETQLHLLGISRCEQVLEFGRYGVTSFDSTSAFRQAFKDDKDNYYTPDRNYVAVRIPQVDGSPRLRKEIKAGRIEQDLAFEHEQTCLRLVRSYADGHADVDEVVDALCAYEKLYDPKKDHRVAYYETLIERPWENCPCAICKRIGVEVILFRGSERNKSRGFHNLYVFSKKLDRELVAGSTA